MEVPEIDFRKQIAEELTRQELIDRLCEYHERINQLTSELNRSNVGVHDVDEFYEE